MKQLSTLNGKKLPIRYGWGALSDLADSINKSIDDLIWSFDPSQLKPSQFSEFVYYGVKDGCEAKNVDFPFESPRDVNKIIDAVGLRTVIKESLAAFQESPFVLNSRDEEEEKEETDKKK